MLVVAFKRRVVLVSTTLTWSSDTELKRNPLRGRLKSEAMQIENQWIKRISPEQFEVIRNAFLADSSQVYRNCSQISAMLLFNNWSLLKWDSPQNGLKIVFQSLVGLLIAILIGSFLARKFQSKKAKGSPSTDGDCSIIACTFTAISKPSGFIVCF